MMRMMETGYRGVRALAGGLVLVAAATTAVQGQQTAEEWLERCERGRDGRATVCEVRESTVTATGSFQVDARPNGGITVRSWDRPDVMVRAKIQAHAADQATAQGIASRIAVSTRPGSASSSGPRVDRNQGWSVSFEVFVPRQTNLTLESVNGGISATGVAGNMTVTTTNGGISLSGVSGSVRGQSTNGGISVQLAGRSWDGAGVDLRTTNGGVRVTLPEGYAANLEASTVNGSISSQVPLSVQGRLGRNVTAEIGGGGPLIRLRTTNGGINIQRS